MKKIVMILFIIVLSFNFASCNKINDIKDLVDKKVAEKESEKNSEILETTEEKNSETNSTTEEQKSSTESVSTTITSEEVSEESTLKEEPEMTPEDFIVFRDINDISSLKDYKWEKVETSHIDPFTGNKKDFYVREDNPEFEIRIPLIISNDEMVERVNEEILNYYESLNLSKVKSIFIDYDASIYEDVLSIRIVSEMVLLNGIVQPLHTNYGLNFDISSGDPVYIPSDEMLSSLGVETSVIEAFISDLIPELYNGFNPLYENNDIDLEEEIFSFLDIFKMSLEQDILSIWKNPNNDYYSMSLNKEIKSNNGYKYYYDITLADSQFKMAMLTRPRNALGIIYKAVKDEIMPNTSLYGNDVVLNKLDDGDGQVVYVASFGENGDFEYYDLEYNIIEIDNENTLFAPRISKKDLNTKYNKDVFNIYSFHTMLPEIIPFEAISVKANVGGEEYIGLDEIYDDMRFGSKIQYIYPSTHLGSYEKEVSGSLGRIKFMDDWNFEVIDEDSWMEDLGFYAKKGKYTSDDMYYYLYPCKEDLKNGASEMLVFKKEKRDKISFYYDSSSKLVSKSFKLTYKK